jgi:hypothetical protein
VEAARIWRDERVRVEGDGCDELVESDREPGPLLGLLRRRVRLGLLVIGLVGILLLVGIGLLRILLLGVALLGVLLRRVALLGILLPILLIRLGLLGRVVLLGLLLLVVGWWGRVILLLLLGVARLLRLRRVRLLLGEEIELGAGEKEDRERDGDDSANEAVWGLGGILAGGARGKECADGHRSLMAPQAFEMPVFSCSCAVVPLLARG